MATTISSGRANSPLLTANIADHGTIYGGRGLIFDGVTDYLDTGHHWSEVFTESFTISTWVKLDDGQPAANSAIFGTQKYDNYTGYVWLRVNTTGVISFNHGTATGQDFACNTSAYFSNGATDWTHIVGVFNKSSNTTGSMSVYINGEHNKTTTEATADASWNIDNYTNVLNGYIGASNVTGTPSYHLGGKISDFKIFNTALTEAQVQELYLKPEQSAPSAVQDNLVAWYPMCEGNPDSPQSIVYDYSKKKLGSETVDNNVESAWTVYGTNEVDNVTDGVKITYGNNGSGAKAMFTDAGLLNFGITASDAKLYKLTFNAYYEGGSSGVYARVYDSSVDHATSALTTTETTYTLYFRGIHATAIQFYFANLASGNVVYITNMSFKEVLMGNHATTNFFGDELVTNGAFVSVSDGTHGYDNGNGTVDGWGVANGANLSVVDEKLKVLHGGSDANPGAIYTFTATAGKRYYASVSYDVSNCNSLKINGDGTNSTVISSGTTGTLTLEFTAAGTGSREFSLSANCDASEYALFDDITLKEVGVSSSGFATAESEPTIPQVPLLRYNEKMSFDGIDDYVALDSTLTLSAAGGTSSVSCWISPDELETSGLSFRSIVGGTHPNIFSYYFLYGNKIKWYFSPDWYTSSETFVSGKLYHVVATINNTSHKLYVNGILDTTITYTAGLSDIYRIGDGPNYEEFRGIIDEVSAWNTELSATEVGELFNAGVPLDANSHSKADNLLGYWRNDGISSWIDRSDIQAVSLDGTGDYIDCGTGLGTALGDNAGDISMSFWFKANVCSQGLLTMSPFNGGSVGEITIWFHDNKLKYSLNQDGWIKAVDFTDTSSWHHLVIVYKADNESESLIYLDNSSVGSKLSGTFPASSTIDLDGLKTIIGGYYSSSYVFNGIVGQTAIWDTALTSSQVSGIYALGRRNTDLTGSYGTNLVAYYTMNPDASSSPDTASTLYDRSTNSNNGTITNGKLLGINNGTPAGSPESLIVREGLNSNKDGLGFPLRFDDRDVLRVSNSSQASSAPKEDFIKMYPDSPYFNPAMEMTVMCWAKNNASSPTATQTLISKYDSGASKRTWDLHVNTGRTISVVFGDPSDGSVEATTTTNATVSGLTSSGALIDCTNWYHYCFTYSAGTFITYVNATVVGHSSSGTVPSTLYTGGENANYINIGTIDNGNDYFWDGLIDEVFFYDKALSATEVSKNYKHGKGKHKN